MASSQEESEPIGSGPDSAFLELGTAGSAASSCREPITPGVN